MTKQYSVPKNIANSTMAMAVLEQIDDAVSTWQIATMSFSDLFSTGSNGITLQVWTPSCGIYDSGRRNELLAYWLDILTNNFPYKEGGELEVHVAYGTTLTASVSFGKYGGITVVSVHLGYFDIKELEAWDADTYDEALYEAVILNAEALIPVVDAIQS